MLWWLEPHLKTMIGMPEKILSSLCYIPFMFIPTLFFSRSKYMVFHVKQGFILSFVWLVWLYLYHFIPYIGWYVIGPVGFVFLVFLSVFGAIKALNGDMEPLPFIGMWVERLRL